MSDVEKVIKGLLCCSSGCSQNCPYFDIDGCSALLANDATALLKEQEAVKPRVDADGTFNCGNCGEPVGFDEHPFSCKVPEIAMKFCCECGKPVKWNV